MAGFSSSPSRQGLSLTNESTRKKAFMENNIDYARALLSDSSYLASAERAHYIEEVLQWDAEVALTRVCKGSEAQLPTPIELEEDSNGNSLKEQLSECLGELKASIESDRAFEAEDPEGNEAQELQELSDEQPKSSGP